MAPSIYGSYSRFFSLIPKIQNFNYKYFKFFNVDRDSEVYPGDCQIIYFSYN